MNELGTRRSRFVSHLTLSTRIKLLRYLYLACCKHSRFITGWDEELGRNSAWVDLGTFSHLSELVDELPAVDTSWGVGDGRGGHGSGEEDGGSGKHFYNEA